MYPCVRGRQWALPSLVLNRVDRNSNTLRWLGLKKVPELKRLKTWKRLGND